jgi:hypothetical protein
MSRIVYGHGDIIDAIGRLDLKVDALLKREADLAKTLTELTADLAANVTSLTEDNAAIKAAVDAAVALLNGVVAQNAAFKVQIAELIALSPTPEQLAKLEEISTGLAAQDVEFDAATKTLTDATAASS